MSGTGIAFKFAGYMAKSVPVSGASPILILDDQYDGCYGNNVM
jgi:hypothetical protein